VETNSHFDSITFLSSQNFIFRAGKMTVDQTLNNTVVSDGEMLEE
jgi:hypothetical protein